MGSYSRTSETGAYETTMKTIGALIEREWDSNNTDSKTPRFLHDDTTTNNPTRTELQNTIEFRGGNVEEHDPRSALGHGLVGVREQVIITIYATSEKRRRLFEQEIQRILREKRPGANSDTPIKKSNESDDSAIHDYLDNFLSFVAFDEDVKGFERSNKSSAILEVIMEYTFA